MSDGEVLILDIWVVGTNSSLALFPGLLWVVVSVRISFMSQIDVFKLLVFDSILYAGCMGCSGSGQYLWYLYFLGQLVCYWTSSGTQLSLWLPAAVACNSGHTLGTGSGELARPGEGTRRVSNPRWVWIRLCLPHCLRSLTLGGTSGRIHPKIQRLWRRWQPSRWST